MVGSRVFLGGLNYRVSEWDIENFFKEFAGVGDITLKNGYAFVEFDDRRDADDAIYEMNGKELLGGRVTVERANERPRDSSRFQRGRRGGNFGGRGSRSPRRGGRDETKYRLKVSNLSRSVTWRDLKDFMRQAGEVMYADAHKHGRNEGVVDFATASDMKNAIRKLDGRDLRGRSIRLVDEFGHLRRRDSSRSRSRSRGRVSRSLSRSLSRGRSVSPPKKQKYRGRSMSRSRSASRDRSRSASNEDRRPARESRSKSRSAERASDEE